MSNAAVFSRRAVRPNVPDDRLSGEKLPAAEPQQPYCSQMAGQPPTTSWPRWSRWETAFPTQIREGRAASAASA